MKKLSAISLLLLALSVAAFTQVSITASATATILTPIAIAKVTDMNFGNAASSIAAGTVVLTPAGARSTTGGVTLPTTAGTVTAATFTVTGQPGFTYAITLPAAATTITSGGNNMTVNLWTSATNPVGAILTGGTSTLTVGATLNVGANQPAGTYVSGTFFTITVNYN